jgi:hypothetical protein
LTRPNAERHENLGGTAKKEELLRRTEEEGRKPRSDATPSFLEKYYPNATPPTHYFGIGKTLQ